MNIKKLSLIIGFFTVLNFIPVFAGIEYDPEKNIIWASDFPLSLPCTPEIILKVDRDNKWDKIEYNKETDTYIINANLYFGSNDGTSTCFQLGDKEHPKVTLIIRGNLVVCPTWIKGENREKSWLEQENVNRITIGDPKDKTITATLKIGGDSKNRHYINIGRLPRVKKSKRKGGYGGDFYVYNSEVTAEVPDIEHAIGSISLSSGNHLVNSKISWVKGAMTYGMTGALADTIVNNTVFENGGTAILNFKDTKSVKKVIRNCEFRNLDTAIHGRGIMMATFENCKFENNKHNWNLASYGWLELIDCEWKKPLEGNKYSINKYALTKNGFIELISQRHIIVQVVDEKNRPIEKAMVTIPREYEKSPAMAVTGNDGKTPGKDAENALMLTEFYWKTTPTTNKLIKNNYSYDIQVKSDGYKTNVIKGFKPEKSWQVVKVVLKKQK